MSLRKRLPVRQNDNLNSFCKEATGKFETYSFGTGCRYFSYVKISGNLFNSRHAFLRKAAPGSHPIRKNPQGGILLWGDVVEWESVETLSQEVASSSERQPV